MTATPVPLTADGLLDILETEVGIDPAEVREQPSATLADLGLDSMAQVELGVVLRTQHGIAELPEDANEMSFDELAGHLCDAKAA